MPNKNIPLKDKAIIKKRLAMGMSYSKAMQGTAVKSKSTVKRILEESLSDITQIRKNYLDLIESFDAHEIDRAKLWAEMARATKLFGKDVIKHPDWRSRAEALKYIDSLAGITPKDKDGTTVNIFNNPEFIAQYDERLRNKNSVS